MARYRGPRLKIVRRFQEPLPGLTQKNGERRPYPPGQHGPGRRTKVSDYRVRLEEKQKLRHNYGLSETQLRRYYKTASSTKGDTGAILLQLLESRLDNAVFRAGYAPTIPAARQLIGHGHVQVAGRKVDRANYQLSAGEVITMREASLKVPMVQISLGARALELPSYLSFNTETSTATFTGTPTREDVPVDVQEQLIIEHYSRVA
jgi:small subunit ribosomal protein S4